RCFSKDELLDTVMLYWLTDTFFTSARYYAESVRNPWRPAHEGMPVVSAPTAYAEFPGEIIKVPRAWAQRYCQLQRWTSMPAGGHFAPMEQPELLVEDVRAFFRGLR
ncbi:MAG: epoxide hydrolase, partial [Gammaproteobacteria bacterium]|nr:epoxide hydrolase [Gammaproteobacteria bacterium]